MLESEAAAGAPFSADGLPPALLDDTQPSVIAQPGGLGISEAADTFQKLRQRMGQAQRKLAEVWRCSLPFLPQILSARISMLC